MQRSSKRFSRVQRLTVLGLLTAIIAVISFLPIRTLGLEITLSMVPVAVGAVVLGPAGGAILGFVFGVVSFLQCLGYSAFGAALFGINPFFCFLVCVPTRTLAGFLPGLIRKAVARGAAAGSRRDLIATGAGSVAAPVFNTLFFMSALTLFFYGTEYIQGYVDLLGAANPVTFIILFVGINGLVELLCGAFLAFPVSAALGRMLAGKRLPPSY